MHTIIVGITASGKSFWSKMLCEQLTKMGTETAVLNPYREPGWKCFYQTTDPDALMEWAQEPRRKIIFLDEAGETLERDARFNWFSSGSRHRGNKVYAITQRLQMVLPTLRANCTEAVIFRTRQSDVEDLADQFGNPRILEAASFSKGEFFMVDSFKPLRHGRLDFNRRRVIWIDDKGTDLRGSPEGTND